MVPWVPWRWRRWNNHLGWLDSLRCRWGLIRRNSWHLRCCASLIICSSKHLRSLDYLVWYFQRWPYRLGRILRWNYRRQWVHSHQQRLNLRWNRSTRCWLHLRSVWPVARWGWKRLSHPWPILRRYDQEERFRTWVRYHARHFNLPHSRPVAFVRWNRSWILLDERRLGWIRLMDRIP